MTWRKLLVADPDVPAQSYALGLVSTGEHFDETDPSAADHEPTLEVGVGPWAGIELPADPHFDVDLLANGDRRNVVDRYRYWSREAIVADLDKRRHDFHVAIENWQHDFNIGTVVRNANAFLAREVHIVGRRRWNRRGAMVTDRYQHVRHHADIDAFVEWARTNGLVIVGLDNVPTATPLETTALPRHCVMLFGQEGPGLSDAALAACDHVYSIAQFGSTRSINAGVASGIAMHAWIRSYVIAGSEVTSPLP
jgi:tRNA(Leu) C34 or U34 (ribose-2'-O)-methylase TrmL